MTDWYDNWKKQSEQYKPSSETAQNVLWLKQMALMSPHFKQVRDAGKENVTESFLNACMQLAYERGTQYVDQNSYERGYEAAMQAVAEKLGFSHEH